MFPDAPAHALPRTKAASSKPPASPGPGGSSTRTPPAAVDRLAFVLTGPPPAPGVPKATARRCRATWIRAQLTSGTRLDTLLRAAGLNSQSRLDEWTPYLPSLIDLERRALLRDA